MLQVKRSGSGAGAVAAGQTRLIGSYPLAEESPTAYDVARFKGVAKSLSG